MENYEKLYKEALERARQVHTTNVNENKKSSEYIFPELKESEDDRIRNAIKEAVEYYWSDDTQARTNILAWLEKQSKTTPTKDELESLRIAAYEPTKNWSEKLQSLYEKLTNYEQGEQKPTPKFKIGDTIHKIGENTVFPRTIEKIEDGYYVCNNSHSFINIKFQDDYELVEQKPTDEIEPKFKVGDWVVQEKMLYQIEEVTYSHGNHFHYCTTDGVWFDDCDEVYLWTIKDAKDGDVLVAKIDKEPNDFIYIFKEYDQNLGFWSHCYLDAYINKFHEGEHHNNYNVGVPATKEQRDLLFQKMHEAGYEWYAEKLELRKIVNVVSLGSNPSKKE